MNRRIYALAVLPLAAFMLASCSTGGGQLGNPRVSGMDAVKARDMANTFCKDVDSLGQEKAITKMATRLAGTDVSKSDQDAIVDFAYNKLCPGNF